MEVCNFYNCIDTFKFYTQYLSAKKNVLPIFFAKIYLRPLKDIKMVFVNIKKDTFKKYINKMALLIQLKVKFDPLMYNVYFCSSLTF